MATIEKIQHRKIFLTDDPQKELRCNRPELRIWADEDGEGPGVTLSVGPLFGENRRFVDMTPDEARTLAVLLKQVADDIDGLMVSRSMSQFVGGPQTEAVKRIAENGA